MATISLDFEAYNDMVDQIRDYHELIEEDDMEQEYDEAMEELTENPAAEVWDA